jgi:hypothetical protein
MMTSLELGPQGSGPADGDNPSTAFKRHFLRGILRVDSIEFKGELSRKKLFSKKLELSRPVLRILKCRKPRER